MYSPVLLPLIGLIVGIVSAIQGISLWWSIPILVIAIAIFVVVNILSNDPLRGFKISNLHYIWIFLLFTTLGIFTLHLNKPSNVGPLSDIAVVTGRVSSVSSYTSGDKAVVKLDKIYRKDSSSCRVFNSSIIVDANVFPAVVDDIVEIHTSLDSLKQSDNYFSSSYIESLRRKGIYYSCECNLEDIKIKSHNATIGGIAINVRECIEQFIEKTQLSKSTQNFIITVLLGNRAYLDSDTRELFADAGISHILALSGMHCAIISMIVMWLLFPMNLFGFYKQRILVTVLIMFAYAFMTGWQASTVRATLMLTVVMVCLFLERKNGAWNSLLLSVFVILLFSPYSVGDVGLQLSFLCVASLIFFVNPLNPFRQHEHPKLHKMASTILATFAATFGVWCVTAWYFESIPVAFLPANLLTVPLLPIYIMIVILYLSLIFLGIDCSLIRIVIDDGYRDLINVIDWLTNGGHTAIYYSPSVINVVLWLLFVTSLAICLNSVKKSKIKSVVTVTFFLGFVFSISYPTNNRQAEEFIIQRTRNEITILKRDKGEESLIKMQRYGISESSLAGKKLLCMDSKVKSIESIEGNSYDITILGSGFQDKIVNLCNKISTGEVIIHPGVRRKKELELIAECDSLGIKCYSIRNQGAYRAVIAK